MQYYKDIELGGETRRVNFSVLAVGEIFKDLEIDLVGLGKLIATENHLLLIPTILFRGIKAGLEEKGLMANFTKNQVAEWCLEKEKGVFDDEIQSVYAVFIDSVYKYFPAIGKLQKELNEPKSEVKKN